jgi:hypothetical protein
MLSLKNIYRFTVITILHLHAATDCVQYLVGSEYSPLEKKARGIENEILFWPRGEDFGFQVTGSVRPSTSEEDCKQFGWILGGLGTAALGTAVALMYADRDLRQDPLLMFSMWTLFLGWTGGSIYYYAGCSKTEKLISKH